MGQFALGIRSLVIKLAIFVAMAALLAWALGGTLFPRAEAADGPAVTWHAATWRLRLEVGGEHHGQARWHLVRESANEKPEYWTLAGFEHWSDAAGPVATDSTLYLAFRDRDAAEWTVAAIDDSGFATTILPDRFEVERQFARLRNGLPLQSAGDAAGARETVLRAERAH
ncbi:MAG: hypothetical protein SGJ09_12745 [Phycisphaerae bacterium]|nr:hypothetical protein [Phycisphaerae bacterium]